MIYIFIPWCCRVSEDFHYSNDITVKTYNRIPLINRKPMPWYSTGDENELVLDIYDKDGPFYNSSNIFEPLSGIHVFIHSSNEFLQEPSYQFYQQYYTGSLFFISPLISLIAENLKSWPVRKRNCLLPKEKKLEYFRIYTKSNCEHECLSKAAFKACRCVPFYLIRMFTIFVNIFSFQRYHFQEIGCKKSVA